MLKDILTVIQIIAAFLPIVAIIVALTCWQHSKANEILHRWAQAEGFTLISAEKRYLRTGRFFFNHSRGQFVFRIVVRDAAGAERSGWLRVGG